MILWNVIVEEHGQDSTHIHIKKGSGAQAPSARHPTSTVCTCTWLCFSSDFTLLHDRHAINCGPVDFVTFNTLTVLTSYELVIFLKKSSNCIKRYLICEIRGLCMQCAQMCVNKNHLWSSLLQFHCGNMYTLQKQPYKPVTTSTTWNQTIYHMLRTSVNLFNFFDFLLPCLYCILLIY